MAIEKSENVMFGVTIYGHSVRDMVNFASIVCSGRAQEYWCRESAKYFTESKPWRESRRFQDATKSVHTRFPKRQQ